jgi:hypothetical protein
MISRITVFACMLLIFSSIGCGWNRPLGSRAGTLDQQRFNASMHDPYSDNEAGPEIVGGRPREFSKPRAEPIRSRAHPASSGNGSWWSNWFSGQ